MHKIRSAIMDEKRLTKPTLNWEATERQLLLENGESFSFSEVATGKLSMINKQHTAMNIQACSIQFSGLFLKDVNVGGVALGCVWEP